MNPFNNTPMIKEKSNREINNFLFFYTKDQCMSNLNNLYDQATQGPHFDLLNESAKEALLNFLESLEELLPALYEHHNWKDP